MKSIQRIMKEFAKKIIYHSSCLLLTIKWFVIQLIKFSFKTIILPDKGKKKLVILANGPSLREVIRDFKRNDDEEIMVVNNFANSEYFFKLKPDYYALFDPAFFFLSKEENANENARIGCLKTIDVIKSIDWNMTLIVPYSVRKIVSDLFEGSNVTIQYTYNNEYYGWKKLGLKLFKEGLFIPRCQNVLIGAIAYGIIKRFQSVTLYGADHSWTEEIRVNDNSELCLINHHFYDSEEPKMEPWRLMDGSVIKMSQLMEFLMIDFTRYDKLGEYADMMGVDVINATKGSYIDSFRKDYSR